MSFVKYALVPLGLFVSGLAVHHTINYNRPVIVRVKNELISKKAAQEH